MYLHYPTFFKRYTEILLDLDGSGILPPFKARCESLPGNRQLTYIGHLNQEATKVDGFEEKGSFVQTILYESTLDTIEHLINQSEKCSQKLQYECKQSRLFDSKVSCKQLTYTVYTLHFSQFVSQNKVNCRLKDFLHLDIGHQGKEKSWIFGLEAPLEVTRANVAMTKTVLMSKKLAIVIRLMMIGLWMAEK